MELDVTHMVDDSDTMPMLSGSRAELGDNAGKLTWNCSVAYGREHPLLTTDDARDEARSHFRGYGAWSEDEIATWSEDELQGIMCQDVAAAIREMEHYDTPEAFEKACESGRASGRLYRSSDKWYFYLGC
jgi:hypothetical protein